VKGSAADASRPPAQRAEELRTLLAEIRGLKRTTQDLNHNEEQYCQRARARLDYLAGFHPFQPQDVVKWNSKRLDRMLVDHLLRQGQHQTALEVAERAGNVDLVDFEMFVDAQKVVAALQLRRCDAALEWCDRHRSRLRKLRSRLEFRLRKQGFLERVRAGDTHGALQYARRELVPLLGTHEDNLQEFQQATATLAFLGQEDHPYAHLFQDSQWRSLVELFNSELYRLHNFTSASLLAMHLQAGLVALKNPQSFHGPAVSPEDPMAVPAFREMAKDLPFAKHVHSRLLCHITGEVMDEDNPPMVFPNGYVYSLRGIESMVVRYPNGTSVVTCPRTGELFDTKALQRAFFA